MGARIKVEGRSTIINGVDELNGAVVESSDLRAGAALCLAAMRANGTSHIRNIHYIDRGYVNFESTLRTLGANIERVEVQEESTPQVKD
jgi:UDP-N-acetylglucosamine 1-carboxyvinyltransferase